MQNPDPPHQPQRFFTIKEVAHELRVSVDTIRRMIRRGTIDSVEVSPRIRRIPREAIDTLARKDHRRGETLW
jgi:excisionase family DNA binding protein